MLEPKLNTLLNSTVLISSCIFYVKYGNILYVADVNRSSGGERHGSASDVDSEEEGEENEYTVYECPGLAPVSNPLL